jgi:RNA polymerase sigma factor (sigma-70 family)
MAGAHVMSWIDAEERSERMTGPPERGALLDVRTAVDAGTASDAAFEQFVRDHFDSLVKSLALIAMDRDQAADAAQEAFLQLHLRWNRAAEIDHPVAWLYRVGTNRCLDYRRHFKRAARLFDRLVASSPPPESASPPTPAWNPDLDFTRTVKALPRRQRVAAVLYFQADMSVGEIARVMQISEGAVKSHLHRARLALRPLLEEER